MNLSQKRVLVVDDDPSIRLLLVTFLRRRGFRLLEARDGGEALAAMRAGGADIVVLDLTMPQVSGWDVLHERAADPSLGRIPVIVVSAGNIREVMAGLASERVSAVLSKPFDLDKVLNAVTGGLKNPGVVAPA